MKHARVKKQVKLNPTFHKDYFEKINEPQKAYWLGYLFNVARVRDDGYFYLARTLNQDIEALVRFSMDLNLNSDILNKRIVRTDGKVDFITYYLSFTNKQFTDGFYGYLPGGDSYINLKPVYPNISPIYNRHFIRGLFDSYSSVMKHEFDGRKYYLIRLDGPVTLLKKIQKILKDEIEMTSVVVPREGTANRFGMVLEIQNITIFPDLILYLYSDVERYNTRKYEQLMDVFHFLYS